MMDHTADDDYIEEASEALAGSHQLVEEVEDRNDDAQEEACMSTGQGEDSMAILEHEAHLLASETRSSEEHRRMHVEVDKETNAIAPPSYAFHYLER
mmetsp:Transcript_20250/g.28937  ORF Transcript_20250/g.28937 Transcript_20250/m.28937 type:complete len:97 (-) Transcript_20250:1-291(-)